MVRQEGLFFKRGVARDAFSDNIQENGVPSEGGHAEISRKIIPHGRSECKGPGAGYDGQVE